MYFPVRGGIFQKRITDLRAVDGVNLQIKKGEILGLVGETGCGKTTLGRCLVRLLKATAGSIYYQGMDISKFSEAKMRGMRQHLQMIFENPYYSLDPSMRVWQLITEPLKIHHLAKNKGLRERADDLLRMVELQPYHAERFPNELSGGERQRVEIARALATVPSFLVCDNPLAHLDVSIQSQLILLFSQLRERHDLTYLFIAHDLALIRRISDRIIVMYSGKFMEEADCEEFFNHPLHPYSLALLSAVMVPDPKIERSRKVLLLPGELPSPISPPTGCRFHTRCQRVQLPLCSNEKPELREVKTGHFVACHFV
jgi:oligopeptide/dipeptide ABC transporter ATP-binding protein